ncbi:probable ATP-dependent RNA helicase DHX34 [Trichomycterus rosablanca]|uniref:probable ATP-dependent RNA helicase DHX34 n=1 Tax=Trichomycterus rosablanca TaxID=2290929 RepID=UPI002F35A293
MSESRGSPQKWDWNNPKCRAQLDELFFQKHDFIQAGSSEYKEFWTFFDRFQRYKTKKEMAGKRQEKQHESKAWKKSATGTLDLGLPKEYDARYRINVALCNKTAKDCLSGGRRDRPSSYSQGITDCLLAMLHFIDFTQKQSFGKLVKLRQEQRNLPIFQYRDRIVELVRTHPVVVVAGDTGCGKSTQVPQYLLSSGFNHIACTQPRRIACISLAKRVSHESLNQHGSEVGYQIRFESSRTSATKLLFLTEGLLLRQIQQDSLLAQYQVVIVDEVHERHLHCDFLLGVLHSLLRLRPDLHLVLMSATINIKLFSSFFNNAPVLQVPGRLFPIQVIYQPIPSEEQATRSEKLNPRPYLRVLQGIDQLYPAEERGDVLIFLSGVAEISTIIKACQSYAAQTSRWIILPLHSTLSVTQQDKVFDIAPSGVRKCIIATNIAETSVTIEGVRFVVDSGKVKEMTFDPKAKMQRLQEFWISRASSEQRKGRAGRTGPGVCYRLYSEADYDAFASYPIPEIHRVALDSLVLQMKSMGLGDPLTFPFLDPPSASSIQTSVTYLKEQGALDACGELTSIGRLLAQLPVDVVIGKVLILGSLFNLVEPVLTVAAALSVQSPFVHSSQHNPDCSAARQPLYSDLGDPFTLLNIFNAWVKVKAERGSSSRKWCKRRGIEEQRLYEMTNLRQQFKEVLSSHGLVELQKHSMGQDRGQRRERLIERNRLHQLRREHELQDGKRRKVLNLQEGLEHESFSGSDEEASGSVKKDKDSATQDIDIQEVKFKLRHDVTRLQGAASTSAALSSRQQALFTLLLSHGLYPQLALPDEHNATRKDSEQVFHTRNKQGFVIHPCSVFASHPDVLHISETSEFDAEKGQSSRHQLLAFVTLLETNKAYVSNCVRVRALQTLLLVANSVDSNADCTRLVVDGWLELVLSDGEAALKILLSSLTIRKSWDELLQFYLSQACGKSAGLTGTGSKSAYSGLEKLSKEIVRFLLYTEVRYSLKQLTSLQSKNLYIGPQPNTELSHLELFPGMKAELDQVKGGLRVTKHFTYNCLCDSQDLYSECLRAFWDCPHCDLHLPVTPLERMQHEATCKSKEEQQSENDPEQVKSSTSKLTRHYHCNICNKNLILTSTEILKHKQQHLS